MSKKAKRIGIVISKLDDKLSLNNAYCTFASYFGTLVPVFALDEQIHTDLDILIMPGGADINPERYGGKPDFNCQNPNLQMEWFDTKIMPQYIEAGIPLFGICRGFQSLGVHFGGRLAQHEPFPYSTTRGDKCEEMIVADTNFGHFESLKDGKKNAKFKANSLHHQGFYLNEYYAGGLKLTTTVVSIGSKNIEGFVHPTLPIAGVQWHPEEIFDTYSINAVKLLLQMK